MSMCAHLANQCKILALIPVCTTLPNIAHVCAMLALITVAHHLRNAAHDCALLALILPRTQAGFDTVSALGRLAQHMKCKKDYFSHAGIKDKSAVTCQEVSARGDPAVRCTQFSGPWQGSKLSCLSRLSCVGSKLSRSQFGSYPGLRFEAILFVSKQKAILKILADRND